MKILVAQLGARMHYAVPVIFERASVLNSVYTDINIGNGGFSYALNRSKRFLPAAIRRLSSRRIEGVPSVKVKSHIYLGLRYSIARSRVQGENATAAVNILYNKLFNKWVVKSNPHDIDTVYSYNSASLEIFQWAKDRGIRTILEQTIAPRVFERQILQLADEMFPGWVTPDRSTYALDEFCEREELEWALSDKILCGSTFVADSIRSFSPSHPAITVVPYGVDPKNFPFTRKDRSKIGIRLRVLTVGAVGLRKGTPLIFAAARQLVTDVEFKLVGPLTCPGSALGDIPGNVTITGAVARDEIQTYYEWADVFLLPSLCEGSSTATYEALLSGVPVICTPNTGSQVTSGIDGLIIPVLDVEAIVHSIRMLIEDRQVLEAMRLNTDNIRRKLSLQTFATRLLDSVLP